MTADWIDTSGALTRRWVTIEKPIIEKPIAEGDPNLMASLRKEMPNILAKCNRSYLEMVRKRNALLKMMIMIMAARRRHMRHPPPKLWDLIRDEHFLF